MPAVEVCKSKRYGDATDQAAKTIHVDTSGDMLLAGDYQGTLNLGGMTVTAPAPSTNVFVARVDASWQALSLQPFAVPYGAVANDPSDPSGKGGVVLAGSYSNNPVDLGCGPLDNTTDLYVAKIDHAGKCLWTKGFSAPGAHVSLAVDPKGTIALVGDSIGPMTFNPGSVVTAGGRDIFVVKLDPASGNVISANIYGGTQDDEANAVTFDATGGMIVTGTFKSPLIDLGGGSVLKNTTGNPHAFVTNGSSWSVGFAGMGEQRPTAVVVEGSVAFVAGDFTDSLGTLTSAMGNRAFFLVGLDAATGATMSGKSFDGTGAKTIRSIAASGSGLLALTGSIDGDVDFGTGKLTSSGGAVIATVEAGPMGQVKWSQAFGGASSAPLVNGAGFLGSNLFVTGAFATTLDLGSGQIVDSLGGSDVFLAKICLP